MMSQMCLNLFLLYVLERVRFERLHTENDMTKIWTMGADGTFGTEWHGMEGLVGNDYAAPRSIPFV